MVSLFTVAVVTLAEFALEAVLAHADAALDAGTASVAGLMGAVLAAGRLQRAQIRGVRTLLLAPPALETYITAENHIPHQ